MSCKVFILITNKISVCKKKKKSECDQYFCTVIRERLFQVGLCSTTPLQPKRNSPGGLLVNNPDPAGLGQLNIVFKLIRSPQFD